jgi:hypothetical protein
LLAAVPISIREGQASAVLFDLYYPIVLFCMSGNSKFLRKICPFARNHDFPMKPIVALIAVLLISWQAYCFAEASLPGQCSVTVKSSSGNQVKDVQVFLVLKEGIFQKGVPDEAGNFKFNKPSKSAYLLAAAPDHEGERILYTGKDEVAITLKESTTRSSVIGASGAELLGKGGSIQPYGLNFMYCSGIVFRNGVTSTFGLNRPVQAIDADGKQFRIYIKEQFPPVYLIEYTH